MQVNDEIAHVGIVDSLLRLGLPGDIGAGIVRKNADDVDLFEILEFASAELSQLAAKDRDATTAFLAVGSSTAMARSPDNPKG